MMYPDPLSHVPAFPKRRRGYDPVAVDQYLQALQMQVTKANSRVGETEDRLRTAVSQATSVDAGSAATLHAAKETAEKTVHDARSRATLLLDEARSRADAVVTDAQSKLDHAKGVHDKIEQMKTDTAAYVAAAEHHAISMREQAGKEAAEIVDRAAEQARETRERADSHDVTTRRSAAVEAESLRSEAREQIAQATNVIREAEDRVIRAAKDQATSIVRNAQADADDRLSSAIHEADSVRDSAATNAEQILADAKAELQRHLRDARAALGSAHGEAKHIVEAGRTEAVVCSRQITDAAEQRAASLEAQCRGLEADAQRHAGAIDAHRAAIAFAIDELQQVLVGPPTVGAIDLDASVPTYVAPEPISIDRSDSLTAELLDNSI